MPGTTSDDHLVAMALSRRGGAVLADRLTLEPEVGIGQRFGAAERDRGLGRAFVRYHGFPWDDWW